MLQNKQSYGLIIKQSSSSLWILSRSDWREPGVQKPAEPLVKLEPSLFPRLLSDQATHSLFLPPMCAISAPRCLSVISKIPNLLFSMANVTSACEVRKSRTLLRKKTNAIQAYKYDFSGATACQVASREVETSYVSLPGSSESTSVSHLVCLPAFKMPGHHFTLSLQSPKINYR